MMMMQLPVHASLATTVDVGYNALQHSSTLTTGTQNCKGRTDKSHPNKGLPKDKNAQQAKPRSSTKQRKARPKLGHSSEAKTNNNTATHSLTQCSHPNL
jgi:hypothetical protein